VEEADAIYFLRRHRATLTLTYGNPGAEEASEPRDSRGIGGATIFAISFSGGFSRWFLSINASHATRKRSDESSLCGG